MKKKKESSLEKIGYITKLPKNADINNYESITITKKNGESIKLYRSLNKGTHIDETTNFSSSLEVFNSFLNYD